VQERQGKFKTLEPGNESHPGELETTMLASGTRPAE